MLPEHHARFNRALDLLRDGRLREGWEAYEARLEDELSDDDRRMLWDGSPLDGRRIVVISEQGFGDTIQFARFVPLLQGGAVAVRTHPALVPLMRSVEGVRFVFTPGTWPEGVDLSVPMMSLPHRLGITTMEQIAAAAAAPYLRTSAKRKENVGAMFRGLPRPHVGIAWAGSASYALDQFRSIPPEQLGPLAHPPRGTVFSLPKGHTPLPGWIDLGNGCDFTDLAAAMSFLDVIVSVDSAPLHLAGALGRPAVGLISTASDWRWAPAHCDGNISRWYPTVRIFRQRVAGQWGEIVSAAAAHLAGCAT